MLLINNGIWDATTFQSLIGIIFVLLNYSFNDKKKKSFRILAGISAFILFVWLIFLLVDWLINGS